MPQQRVQIFDTTIARRRAVPGLLDGSQREVRMAHKLRVRCRHHRGGFSNRFGRLTSRRRSGGNSMPQCHSAALCRTLEQDVARAAEALSRAAHRVFIQSLATSDIHLEHKLRKTRSEVIDMTRSAVHMARNFAEEVEFSAEDATRSDVDYLCEYSPSLWKQGLRCSTCPTP